MKSDAPEFLLQFDILDEVLPQLGKEQWQTLYLSARDQSNRLGVWCALLDDAAAARAMEKDGWDLLVGEHGPGFSQGWLDGKEITTYDRFGGREGVRPLVLYREFHGAFPQYVEIDEEFRLYHNLAEDQDRGLLLDFDSSGREIEVVRIKPTEVKAQLKYLKQFQAATRLNLAIYIDSLRFSKLALEDVPESERDRAQKGHWVRWVRNVRRSDFADGYPTFSRFLCKVILEPPVRETAGKWPYEDDECEKEVSFIIGIDGNGNELEYTSDHSGLGNYFGGNPNAPHYLTPVYFRREVLGKYYAEPERYTVVDGRLSCLGLWSCQIDNDLESQVVVFLGDLGRDLPYEERLHWRQYNIPPQQGISATNFRRSFLAQFADAQAPDLVFRQEYADLAREWEAAHGWPLFLPPKPGDSHLLNTIRIPVSNSQPEFDEQIGHLTKLLIDSLNEKEIVRRVATLPDRVKGIEKLDAFFGHTGFLERQEVIQFLRGIQSLRSTGSAHRKGSQYDQVTARLGIDLTKKPDSIRRLLETAISALRQIRRHYCLASKQGGG